jgi:hypothetical protein
MRCSRRSPPRLSAVACPNRSDGHLLTKTNEQLRELVTQLSALVIRNVVDRENRKSLLVEAMARARS